MSRIPLRAVCLAAGLGSVVLGLAACAGRAEPPPAPPAEEVEAGPVALEPLVPPPPPPPQPPELACTASADCVWSQYLEPVTDVADCYCLPCPEPRARSVAQAQRRAWEAVCAAWAVDRGCLAPFCAAAGGPLACAPGGCAAEGGG